MERRRNGIIQGLLWVLEGIIVGFGAIMPGISGAREHVKLLD